MAAFQCPREPDILDALTSQRWPDRADDERAHVAGCEICADLVAVVGPLLEEREAAFSEVRVPPASVVWWRAQIRARHEASRVASRPMTIAQAVAMTSALMVAGALVMTGWANIDGWRTALRSIATNLRGLEVPMPTLASQSWVLVGLAVGLSLIVAPVAIYLAVSEE